MSDCPKCASVWICQESLRWDAQRGCYVYTLRCLRCGYSWTTTDRERDHERIERCR